MLNEEQLEDLVNLLLSLDKRTKVYLGCDSVRFKGKDDKRYARYATVCIVHKNGNTGCKIFSSTSIEPDYDQKVNRPKMRMITEAQKVCQLYEQVAPLIDPFEIEIHLDINLKKTEGSNCAAQEASGYVLGLTGLKPIMKNEPEGESTPFASSYGADAVAHGRT